MSTLAGTAAFAKLAGRRDRIMLPVWIYVLAGLTVGTAYGFKGLYPTPAGRGGFALGVAGNPSLLAFYGPIYGDSIGSMTAWRFGLFAAVGAALMSVFMVIRHTRADEESGRLELLGSACVGRHAALASALLVTAAANVVVGALIAVLVPLFDASFAGSAALGIMVAASGLIFMTIAAITAQLAQAARTARGIALSVLGAAYLLRAVGDAAGAGGPSWLTWLSPVGWAEEIRAYAQIRWWVVALPVVTTLILTVIAGLLAARRDYDAGLIGQLPGRAGAKPSLRGPMALAWRLQGGAVIAWLAASVAFGVVIGAATKGIQTLVNTSTLRQEVARLGGTHGLTDAFLAAMIGFMALVAAGFAISAVLRMRSEESDGRAEPILAGGVSRLAWGMSHLTIAVAGTVVLLALMGASIGLGYVARAGGGAAEVGRLLGAGLAQAPAVLVLAGLTMALLGFAPRISVAGGWTALGVTFALAFVGAILQLSHWVMDISPFTHIPKLPGGALTAQPLAVLSVIAVALFGAGLAGLRHRDIG